jgi:hypothetical protein
MNKLILSLLFLTLILSCQNENNRTKNNSTSNDKSSDENQAKILKEKEEQRIKDSLKSVEDEKKEIETYSGNYFVPPPSGPGTGVCSDNLIIKNNRLICEEICGGNDWVNGHFETQKILFNVEFKPHKVYKVSSLFNITEYGALGCDYFEFKNNKLYLYDENMKIVNEDFCCGFVKKCDCIISKSK